MVNCPSAWNGAHSTPWLAPQCNSLAAKQLPNIFKASLRQVSSAVSLLTFFHSVFTVIFSFPLQIYLDAKFSPSSILSEGTHRLVKYTAHKLPVGCKRDLHRMFTATS